MKNEDNFNKWVWIDLEMTGLDENDCVILEIAMIITNPNLEILASIDMAIWQPEAILATMVPIVRSLHSSNGLLERVRTSAFSLKEAEDAVLKVLTEHVEYKKGILAGNSMYVDRRFLQKYMPSVENYLHYRQIDVSSIKLLATSWYDNLKTSKKPSSHRALDDIKASIAELGFYKANIFKDN